MSEQGSKVARCQVGTTVRVSEGTVKSASDSCIATTHVLYLHNHVPTRPRTYTTTHLLPYFLTYELLTNYLLVLLAYLCTDLASGLRTRRRLHRRRHVAPRLSTPRSDRVRLDPYAPSLQPRRHPGRNLMCPACNHKYLATCMCMHRCVCMHMHTCARACACACA